MGLRQKDGAMVPATMDVCPVNVPTLGLDAVCLIFTVGKKEYSFLLGDEDAEHLCDIMGKATEWLRDNRLGRAA